MIDRLLHSMQALQRLMKAQEVTANNMANLNTPGFKSDKMFYHAFVREMNGANASIVKPQQTINMEQGNFELTENPYDLAIEGEGFFSVELNGQELLTRNGRFQRDADGFLVNDDGAFLMGENGAVSIPPLSEHTESADNETRVEISKDGTVSMNDQEIDRIQLVKTDNLPALQRHAAGYYVVPPGVELTADSESAVLQGFYEAGNVDPLKEMVSMMSTAGMFEAQQKVMVTTDELLSRATNSIGRF